MAAPFLQTVRTGFSRSFWVANTLELFERFSYYASKAVLAVYLAEHLGLGPTTATLFAGSIFNTLIYLLPALAGTVVDRYGFRRSLMLCFSIFSVGCATGWPACPSRSRWWRRSACGPGR